MTVFTIQSGYYSLLWYDEFTINSPDIYEQFDKGHVVLNESLNQFSVLALDQAHEHNNAIVKADGGAVGIT